MPTKCTYDNGTTIRAYEALRFVVNSLRSAILETNEFLHLTADSVNLCLGRNLVVPIIDEGTFVLQEMPEMRFWALRISFDLPFFDDVLPSITLPFWKESLEDVWRSAVGPYDLYVDGSEYWFYRNDDGDILQGVEYTPVRKFGILGDGGPLVRDLSLVVAIIWLLNKLGLFKVLGAFIDKVMLTMKNRKIVSSLRTINQRLINQQSDIDDILEDVISLGGIPEQLDSIKRMIGGRLRL